MSKFETKETLLYKFLIEDLKDDLYLTEQRVDILTKEKDFENAIYEEKQAIKLREKIEQLTSYLEEANNAYYSRPCTIDISYTNQFRRKNTTIVLESRQKDDSVYYAKETGVVLKDWKQLERNKEYLFHNMILQVDDKGVLYSRYPQEKMWYHFDEDYFFNKFAEDMIYHTKEEV